MTDCDQEIQQRVEAFQTPKDDGPTAPTAESSDATTPRPRLVSIFTVIWERIFGLDLTLIPGFDVLRIQTIFSEIGARSVQVSYR